MLASVAALPSTPARGPELHDAHEHIYEVRSRINLPQHGLHLFEYRLRLTELISADQLGPLHLDDAQLHEMHIETNKRFLVRQSLDMIVNHI